MVVFSERARATSRGCPIKKHAMAENEFSILLIASEKPYREALTKYLSAPGRKVSSVPGAAAELPLSGRQPDAVLIVPGPEEELPPALEGLTRDILAILVAPAGKGGLPGGPPIILERGADLREDRQSLFPALDRLISREEERRNLFEENARIREELDRRAAPTAGEEGSERIRDLRERIEALLHREEEKTEFMNLIAHKMRTPLTAIIGFAEILDSGGGEVEDRDGMVRSILQAAIDLGNFVNDAVEFLQRSSGNINLQKAEFDLVPHLQKLIRERNRAYSGKRIRVVYRGLNSLNLVGDSRSIVSAIDRVLDNAFKFSTPDDVVEISLQEENRSPLLGGSTMVLKVLDHGAGLHRHQIEKLFKPLEIYSDPEGSVGHGLGLAIAQEAVRAHGGKIAIHSEGPSKGCLVTIEIPLGRYHGSFVMNRIPLGEIRNRA
jgi:signal transduction histidine kinase